VSEGILECWEELYGVLLEDGADVEIQLGKNAINVGIVVGVVLARAKEVLDDMQQGRDRLLGPAVGQAQLEGGEPGGVAKHAGELHGHDAVAAPVRVEEQSQGLDSMTVLFKLLEECGGEGGVMEMAPEEMPSIVVPLSADEDCVQ
ncbi:hypothetical protein BGZ59_003514, partial [Podila verticillata]